MSRTFSVACKVCEQSFALAASAKPENPTCSIACREALNRRRARHRALIAWSSGSTPVGPQPPNRIAAALEETRAAVERLLAYGRKLHGGNSGTA